MTPSDRSRHPIFARYYARASVDMDRIGMADHRARLLSGLTGTVLEAGCGNGRNFPHYPDTVTRVVAIEPDPYLRARAEQAAKEARVPIEIVNATAEHIPAPDNSFDAAVVCLVLCSVPDQATALAELGRVLRPGGQLRFLEHVRAETPILARIQRVLEATLWPHMAGGCHPARDTGAAIRAAFTIDEITRFDFPPARIRQPASPHITGTATSAQEQR
ncbi:MAG TPA: class I SAM-dependent methyltransferase [Actinocrinis sp.]|nr:class I SAM-dependent methyltransferase [Actinocrinis sp.]